MDAALRNIIRERAEYHCEYCRINQVQDPFFTFPIDHIIARQHGGKTESDNLCLSCYRCNSHKGPNIASIDSDTGEMVPLFHPRRDNWHEHFEWNGTPFLSVARPLVARPLRYWQLTIRITSYCVSR